MTERRKQYKCVFNTPSVKDRLQTMRTTFESFISKIAQKNGRYCWTQWGSHSLTINFFIEFNVTHKKLFVSVYVKKIMKNILKDLRGILFMIIQNINTNINGFDNENTPKISKNVFL